jgi:uncharacterized UPF0146 family protein
MGAYKHIERCIGEYVSEHYRSAVEVGIGRNTTVAQIVHDAGMPIRCTDIRDTGVPAWLSFSIDDVFSPELCVYQGADVIYAIRPAIEMVPPLLALALAINSDLLIYHLGFELYENGGERIDCGGVLLHRYVTTSEPVKQG